MKFIQYSWKIFRGWHPALQAVAAIVLVLVVVSALGGGSSTTENTASPADDTTAQATEETAVASQDAPQEETASQEAPKPKPKRVKIPNVVGMNHQDAQDTMQAKGLYTLSEKDCTGMDRMLVLDSNWTVQKQTPAAGRRVKKDAKITLCSVKSDEVTSASDEVVDEEPEEEPAEFEMTDSQSNALEAARNYLDFSGFSKQGLIEQLSSDAGDGYSKADATFAAENVGADWKEEAVESAQNYLDVSSFSKQGLTEQLTSEAGDEYTEAQARYAVNKVTSSQVAT